ncbi:Kinase-like protein [Mycena sanguinolenta]|uniref:Kinase-like protein n=1 Tax=Mycena sanguinolenta TaxID=230812 RepID=A0A8H7D9D5_9AGAR|nr:Kinase-like protein [Mycena sanguinolenta]
MLDPRNMYPDGFYTGFFLYDHRKRDFTGCEEVHAHAALVERLGTVLVPYIIGGDEGVPETKTVLRTGQLLYADPFASDVWWVGNVLRKYVQRCTGLDFLTPHLDEMCHENPEDRLTMAAAEAQFGEILQAQPWWRLRRLTIRKKNHFLRLLQALQDNFPPATESFPNRAQNVASVSVHTLDL